MLLVAGVLSAHGVAGVGLVVAVASDAAVLPAAAPRTVTFVHDIKPMLEASCIACHAHGQKKGRYAVDSRELFLAGGASGAGAIPGDSAGSLVVQLVAGLDLDRLMPAKGPRWTPEQIGVLRAWIDQGAPWPEDVRLGRGVQARLEPRPVELPPASGPSANPVDRLLAPYFERRGFTPPAPVEDRVFARRVYLDTIGLLPTPEQLRAFVEDSRPDKRATLVRRLLGDHQRYAEHWLSFWNDCLRNDYQGTGYIDGGRQQITPWLYEALANNLPFDQFVTRLVNPDERTAGFTKGIVWRGVVNASQTPPLQAAQNLSQVFLGLNLKCASCHDSFVNDWTLSDAYGLASIYADEPLELVRCDVPTGVTAQRQFLFPQLGPLANSTNRAERLASLARLMTSPDNGRFTRTIVNRLWARLLGRGLVEPVDEMDDPPWHADLLDWLAVDLASHHYDLKRTLTLILTSHAYQLPAVPGEEQAAASYVFRGPVVKRLSAEQYADALSSLTGLWRERPANADIDLLAGEPTARPPLPPTRWIWTDSTAAQGAPPGTVYFRKTFHLDTLPAQALALATADNRFRLFLNGHEIGTGDDWKRLRVLDLRRRLVTGPNVLAVEATNGRSRPDDEADTTPNPAGFLFVARLTPDSRHGSANPLALGSDASWLSSSRPADGWERAEFVPEGWQPAVELGPPQTAPWNLEHALAATWSNAAQYGTIRAVHVATDPLMTALGRPNREQVNTSRPTAATTLQALELTNGQTLANWLNRAADRLLASTDDLAPASLARHLYLHGLGRPPNPDELDLARELLGQPVQREGLEDLLWALSVLPEFQLIY